MGYGRDLILYLRQFAGLLVKEFMHHLLQVTSLISQHDGNVNIHTATTATVVPCHFTGHDSAEKRTAYRLSSKWLWRERLRICHQSSAKKEVVIKGSICIGNIGVAFDSLLLNNITTSSSKDSNNSHWFSSPGPRATCVSCMGSATNQHPWASSDVCRTWKMNPYPTYPSWKYCLPPCMFAIGQWPYTMLNRWCYHAGETPQVPHGFPSFSPCGDAVLAQQSASSKIAGKDTEHGNCLQSCSPFKVAWLILIPEESQQQPECNLMTQRS